MVDGIRISVNDETIRAVMDRIDRVAMSPAQIMADISAFMVTAVQRHIERETGPAGKWPALSPRTARKKIGRGRRRGTANMLRVSNRLYSSITGDSTDTEAIAGTNVIYAAIQHFGGEVKKQPRLQDIHLSINKGRKRFVRASAKRKRSLTVTIGAHTITVPARPYLYLDEADAREIEQIAAEAFRREADLP